MWLLGGLVTIIDDYEPEFDWLQMTSSNLSLTIGDNE